MSFAVDASLLAGGGNATTTQRALSAAASARAAATLAASSVLCCLPTPPCGILHCTHSTLESECSLLQSLIAPIAADSELCDTGAGAGATELDATAARLPTWEDILPNLQYIPIATVIGTLVLWTTARGIYQGLNLRVSSFVVNHIGCNDHPYPRVPFFLMAVNWCEICASLATLCLFITNTYLKELTPVSRWTEVCLGCFMTCHLLVRGCREEFGWRSILRQAHLIDFATIPSMLLMVWQVEGGSRTHWISLSYLRSVSALLAFEELKGLGAIRIGSGELLHELTSMGLRFLALAVCFASTIFLLEVLGEPPWVEPSKISTAMGDLTFLTMMYWICETITTVGYGDFAPKTVFARMVTILCMITGFAFLGLELEGLFSIIARRKKGSGSYIKTKRKHVVLVGGGVQQADELLLLAFLEELFHVSYRTEWPDLVVMVADVQGMERIREMIDGHLEWTARQQIHYLVGSPLNMADLKRCRCDVASVVFVLCDTSGKNDPQVEDKENLLRALSLKNSFPQTPLRLMLLLQESKEKAFGVGIQPHLCLAMNELKHSLFWQSCRCKGWNTLLCNLMVTTETDDIDTYGLAESPWAQEYIQGVGHEVYGLLPAEEFWGMSFGDLTVEAHKRAGICIFAAQIHGRIEPAPLKRLKSVNANTVLFALAQDEADLEGVATEDPNADWREVFSQNRKLWAEQTASEEGFLEPAIIRASKCKKDQSFDTLPSSTINSGYVFLPPPYPDLPEIESLAEGVSSKLDVSRSPKAPEGGLMLDDAIEEGSVRSNSSLDIARRVSTNIMAQRSFGSRRSLSGASRTSSSGQTPRMSSRMGSFTSFPNDVVASSDLRDLERKAEVIKANAASAPFALLLDLSNSWENIVPFLMQSRSSYLPFDLPIIVVSSALPPKAVVVELLQGTDRGFGFVRGNLYWAPDLIRGGAQECSVVVALGQESGVLTDYGTELIPMLDADVIMLQRMLHTLGVMNKALIFEFKRTQNMRLLPAVKWLRAGDGTSSRTSFRDGDSPRRSAYNRRSRSSASSGSRKSESERPTQQLQVQQLQPQPAATNATAATASANATASGSGSPGIGPPHLSVRPSANSNADKPSYVLLDMRVASTFPREADSLLLSRDSSREMVRVCSARAARSCRTACTEEELPEVEVDGDLDGAFYLDPRFASGEIFTPHVVGALLAHVFYTPGVVEVMQALVLPQTESEDAIFPWLVILKPQDEGKTYGEIFEAYVATQVHPVLPMGLLRCVERSPAERGAHKPYVWTNPSHHAIIQRDDLLYVLGDRRWGQYAYETGRLPMSGRPLNLSGSDLMSSNDTSESDAGSSRPVAALGFARKSAGSAGAPASSSSMSQLLPNTTSASRSVSVSSAVAATASGATGVGTGGGGGSSSGLLNSSIPDPAAAATDSRRATEGGLYSGVLQPQSIGTMSLTRTSPRRKRVSYAADYDHEEPEEEEFSTEFAGGLPQQ